MLYEITAQVALCCRQAGAGTSRALLLCPFGPVPSALPAERIASVQILSLVCCINFLALCVH